MTSHGLSERGMGRIHDVLSGHVERGALPGLISLVARRGVAHVDVIGTKAFGDREPMGRDAIFRIASLTKPVSAVAAMILVEHGTVAERCGGRSAARTGQPTGAARSGRRP